MTNLLALTQPKIDDPVSLEEFKDDLVDLAQKIEQDIGKLKHAPDDRTIIANLFRAFHNIKGDAALCKVELGAIIAHPIETLLGRLREGELQYTDLMGEIILLTVDRLELATESLVSGRSLENLQLVRLLHGLEKLSLVGQAELNDTASRVIESVTGFRPATERVPDRKKRASTSHPIESQVADLQFQYRFTGHERIPVRVLLLLRAHWRGRMINQLWRRATGGRGSALLVRRGAVRTFVQLPHALEHVDDRGQPGERRGGQGQFIQPAHLPLEQRP